MFIGYIDPGTGYTIFSFGGWIIASILAALGLIPFFFKKIFNFIKKHWKIFFFILLIVIVTALIIIVAMNKAVSSFDKKMIILGYDGLSPKIIEQMMAAGELPNFSKLKQQGSYKHLATTNPPQSPVAWSGFATGQNPGKNGVYDFIVRDPKDYSLRLSLSNIVRGKPRRVIKSKCFWNYATDVKVPSIIIGCPVTFPPDKIYGRMLSGMGVPDILGTEGTFTFYTSVDEKKDEKDIGGNVFKINKNKIMVLNLLGPKVAGIGKRSDHTKVPFKVKLDEKLKKIEIDYQNQKFELEEGKWSKWKEVEFKVGMFKKAKGILKFYLVKAGPEFKLYITPVNFDPRDQFFAITYPKDYGKELAEKIGLFYTQGEPMDTWAMNEGRLGEKPFIEQANEILNEKKAMLDLELGRLDKGILYCYFESPDIIQHMFWRYTDPQNPMYEADAPKEYKNMIRSWYIKLDKILGKVMDKISDDDTLIVLSDHGFNTYRRSVHLNAWLWENEMLELKNPYLEYGRELLTDINWNETKAYAIGFGAIYINQKGREKNGIVEPGEETEKLKQEIIDGLMKWKDKKYGQNVVSKVYRKEDIFHGKYAKNAPDLYVGFNIGYRASWQTALGAVPVDKIEDNKKKWAGSHLFDPELIPGILFTNKKITKEKASIYDITPTIVKLIGYDNAKIEDCNFDGSPLF